MTGQKVTAISCTFRRVINTAVPFHETQSEITHRKWHFEKTLESVGVKFLFISLFITMAIYNLSQQLDHLDFGSEISLVHLANL